MTLFSPQCASIPSITGGVPAGRGGSLTIMNKKAYQQPALCIVTVEPHAHLLDASPVQTVSTTQTVDINYGGGNAGAARVKGNSVDWDDWSE